MNEGADLVAKLEQAAAGKAPRPRGNAVTADEWKGVHVFAAALHHLTETSLFGDRLRDHDEDAGDIAERFTAPSEALPPLP